MTTRSALRVRWAAVGAAVAVTLGAVGLGGLNIASADVSEGNRPVFIPINPCRLLDTRPGDANVGPKSSPLGPGETHTVTAHGDNGECTAIPTDALSLSLNVTAVGASASTFLTFWGDGANPGTSNLNPRPGAAPTPNSVNTPLSDSGTFNVYNDAGSVNIIADVNGYYASHDHDDRYYTEEEADARFAPAGADVTPINILSYYSQGTTNWSIEVGQRHTSSASVECIVSPVDLPIGRTVEGVSFTYLAPAEATLRVGLIGIPDAVGTFTSELDLVDLLLDEDIDLEATEPSTIDRMTVDIVPQVVAPGTSYILQLCTRDTLLITSTSVSTPLR